MSESESVSYNLSSEKRALVVALLCEGMGIRPLERATNIHRDTIMRLGRDVGEGYARLHDQLFVNLNPARIELDEAWSFVHTKQMRTTDDDPADYGDQYSFIAMDPDSKAIIAYHVGKRNKANTIGLALDLANRLVEDCKPAITSDGFGPYVDAVQVAFGPNADFGVLIKEYRAACATEAAVRYQPANVKVVGKKVISGEMDDDEINTAYVERQNLTLRMLTRRFSRLTNAHSKILRNHRAAFDLYVGYYNFCWVHSSLGKTPAMAAGVASEVWPVDRLVKETYYLAQPHHPPIRPGHREYEAWLQERQREKQRRKRR